MTGKPAPSDIHIGRLVFDVPGLDPRQARALAESVALHLSAAGIAGAQDRITVDLPGREGDLVQGIVAALLRRLA